MKWWQYLVFPFAVLYDMGSRFRNHLYNISYKPSFSFEINVILVGNLSLGGTGKSPMIMYLLNKLQTKGRKMATLSRGYGRKTRGFLIATSEDSSETLGDEPFLFYSRFQKDALVAVGEDRAFAIPQLLFEQPELDLIVMDDGFQHRTVRPSLAILLTTFRKPFYTDFVVPSGRLREARSNASRADIMIVTKCPSDLSEEVRNEMVEQIKIYAPEIKVFFTGLRYGKPYPLHENAPAATKKVIAVAGIAEPDDFFSYAAEVYELIEVVKYPDHYSFKAHDIKKWLELAKRNFAMILITEKDMVKLQEFDALREIPVMVQPVEVQFLAAEDEFLTTIEESLVKYERKG